MVAKYYGYLFISICVQLALELFYFVWDEFLLNIETHIIADVYGTYHYYIFSKSQHLKLLIWGNFT